MFSMAIAPSMPVAYPVSAEYATTHYPSANRNLHMDKDEHDMLIMNDAVIDCVRREPSAQNWNFISYRWVLTLDFVKEFEEFINWKYMSMAPIIDAEILDAYTHKVIWCTVSSQSILSEDKIARFKNYLKAELVCRFQNLSEDFILEQGDWLNWEMISAHQKLSMDFIWNQRHRLCFELIFEFQQHITEEFIDICFNEYLNKEFAPCEIHALWISLSWNRSFTESFLIDHRNDVLWHAVKLMGVRSSA